MSDETTPEATVASGPAGTPDRRHFARHLTDIRPCGCTRPEGFGARVGAVRPHRIV